MTAVLPPAHQARDADLFDVYPTVATACDERCPECGAACTGGPVRYRSAHLCLGLHQWGERP